MHCKPDKLTYEYLNNQRQAKQSDRVQEGQALIRLWWAIDPYLTPMA